MNWAAKRFFGSRVPACHPDASQTPVGRAGKNDGADQIGKNDPADEIIYVTDVCDLALADRDTSRRNTSRRDTSHCDMPHILLCDASAWRAGLSLQKRYIASMREGTQP